MEIFFEFLFELYLELIMLAVPEKTKSKTVKILAVCLVIFVLVGIVFLFGFGVDRVNAGHTATGALCIAGAVLLGLAQLIAGVCLSGKSE